MGTLLPATVVAPTLDQMPSPSVSGWSQRGDNDQWTYEGKDMRAAHEAMQITNAEFDASVGDLKASLDAKGVPTEEQKELLSIIESARPQVVEKR